MTLSMPKGFSTRELVFTNRYGVTFFQASKGEVIIKSRSSPFITDELRLFKGLSGRGISALYRFGRISSITSFLIDLYASPSPCLLPISPLPAHSLPVLGRTDIRVKSRIIADDIVRAVSPGIIIPAGKFDLPIVDGVHI
jgi:hypothetical protein